MNRVITNNYFDDFDLLLQEHSKDLVCEDFNRSHSFRTSISPSPAASINNSDDNEITAASENVRPTQKTITFLDFCTVKSVLNENIYNFFQWFISSNERELQLSRIYHIQFSHVSSNKDKLKICILSNSAYHSNSFETWLIRRYLSEWRTHCIISFPAEIPRVDCMISKLIYMNPVGSSKSLSPNNQQSPKKKSSKVIISRTKDLMKLGREQTQRQLELEVEIVALMNQENFIYEQIIVKNSLINQLKEELVHKEALLKKKRLVVEAVKSSSDLMDPQFYNSNKAWVETECIEKLASLQREKLMLGDFIGAKKKGLLSPKSTLYLDERM